MTTDCQPQSSSSSRVYVASNAVCADDVYGSLNPSYYVPQPIGWIHPNLMPMAYHCPVAVGVQANWRKGKWFDEEEVYTKRLIEAFNAGHLSIPSGTTLRSFLSEKLNCDPMRITKKFAGTNCIGKQVFTPCNPSTDPSIIKRVNDELEALAEKFQAKVELQKSMDSCPLTPQAYYSALQQYQLNALIRDSSLQQEYLAAAAAQQMYYNALMKSYIADQGSLAADSTTQPVPLAANPGCSVKCSDLCDLSQPLPFSSGVEFRLSPQYYVPEQLSPELLAPRGSILSSQMKSNFTFGVPGALIDSKGQIPDPNSSLKDLTKGKRPIDGLASKRAISTTVSSGDDILASDLLLNFYKAAKTIDTKHMHKDQETVQSDPSTDGEEQLSVTDSLSRNDSNNSLSAMEDIPIDVPYVKRRKFE